MTTALRDGHETERAEVILARYRAIRHRLPPASFPAQPRHAPDLGALADRFDAVLFDAFGVLNVGTSPIPGAADRIGSLRRMGKRLLVLSNTGSATLEDLALKYQKWGFDFQPEDIVSARSVLEGHLQDHPQTMLWSAIGPAESRLELLPARTLPHGPEALARADGFLFLSSAGWDGAKQEALVAALKQRPRPVLVGNPDLGAPYEDAMSREPGLYAHDIQDRTGVVPQFFGKPFANAFDAALGKLPGIAKSRIAMLGDTLHTDILGAAAAGIVPVLVTGHGVLKGCNIDQAMAEADIRPAWIIPSI